MSATKAGKRPLRSLSAQEKLSAIQRVSVGGESKASVARDIGVPESTLRGWCKNQEKISYQVRTSPSNLEEAPENLNVMPAKRIKLEDQPYNLSMKTSEVSNGSYSPNSETIYEEYPTKPIESELETSPLNLRTANKSIEPLIPVPVLASTPKATSNIIVSGLEKERQEKEREKNRAELARLSAELGLNRPEVLMSTLGSNNNLNDVTTALLQWKSVYQAWYYQQQKMLQQPNKNGVVPSIPDAAGPNKMVSPNNGLLTTVDKRDKMLPTLEQQPSVYDSVSYWLRQQNLLGLNNNNNCQQSLLNMASCLPSTSTVTSVTNTTTSAANPILPSAVNDLNAAANQNSSQQQLRLWNWYQQQSYNAQLQATASVQPQRAPQLSPVQRDSQQQILYQQLTKEPSEKEINSENETTKEDKPKNNSNKNRSVLDNLLLNNNTIECSIKKEEVESLDAHEAIEHGEKFLHWLEHCSDPSVTTLQLHTVQSLIKNLKNGFDRRSSDCQNRNKVRRK